MSRRSTGRLDVDAVGTQLSDVAQVLCESVLALASADVEARGERVPPLVLLGLGRLGGREMGYASDLDVLFVYDSAGQDPGEAQMVASRVAQTPTEFSGVVSKVHKSLPLAES